MTLENLKQSCLNIDKLINETIKSDIEDTFPITDGLIDPERYFNAKYKILWILKEPVDEIDEDGTPYGGGWSLMEALRPKKTLWEFTGGRRTFRPMIYTTYGILNDFCLYDEMEYVEKDPSILDAFKSIGYINVKKLPGMKMSSNDVIARAYQQYKEILHRQIADYSPDIIIGGSTLQHFFQDLGITPSKMRHEGNVRFAIQNGKVFIDAYHPCYWAIPRYEYCDDIIKTVEHWAFKD